MSKMKRRVQLIEISSSAAGQRIDNFLFNRLKKVPKSMIYRILRKGQVRVNKKRIQAKYKLQSRDLVRIPPVTIPIQKDTASSTINTKLRKISELECNIVFEDEHILILNKPSGTAVHGGSGLEFGVIEGLRALKSSMRFLELVHRIDKDTSGILLIAKKRSALRHLQAQFRMKVVKKFYVALTKGEWKEYDKIVKAPLLKNELSGLVRVSLQGKSSETRFKIMEKFPNATLVQVNPITGRTHQIRVHSQHVGHPVAWDERYGSKKFDMYTRQLGLNRLFLHASKIEFIHPSSNKLVEVSAPMEEKLEKVLIGLRKFRLLNKPGGRLM
ncbi:ribosomal large subunit pseudouridine synthase [Candidatus Photodesmus blepharus]|uniref:Pseudouridine synthase n=1 Tax=Candidatus Photodesmus blepharonis TaxID=1179155 RepID=A0A084CPK8_9GAMM|nr:23S rRNA pseudouridine(955/2504/2580) synthase RluC [Candidatus Photodesmus blepharus]KEY91737.1 ribosomal large subunit pseudouridine synthase [Candidatus Photodesmus blepharus]